MAGWSQRAGTGIQPLSRDGSDIIEVGDTGGAQSLVPLRRTSTGIDRTVVVISATMNLLRYS
jgi:hypothetical protein